MPPLYNWFLTRSLFERKLSVQVWLLHIYKTTYWHGSVASYWVMNSAVNRLPPTHRDIRSPSMQNEFQTTQWDSNPIDAPPPARIRIARNETRQTKKWMVAVTSGKFPFSGLWRNSCCWVDEPKPTPDVSTTTPQGKGEVVSPYALIKHRPIDCQNQVIRRYQMARCGAWSQTRQERPRDRKWTGIGRRQVSRCAKLWALGAPRKHQEMACVHIPWLYVIMCNCECVSLCLFVCLSFCLSVCIDNELNNIAP